MNFPVNAFHELSFDQTLLAWLLVGLGFGFMLERGGFGSSRVLAGIFYGRDWRVLKVMFSAILTAMLGLYAADGLGWVAMDQLAFKSTYIWGQIAGGLLLGVGFVTAGYCPGTSIVGIASGKLDALFVMFGLVLGTGLFEEAYAGIAGFYQSGYLGEINLAQWLGIPTGVVVMLIVAMGLGAFSLVARFERKRAGETLPRAAWRQAGAVAAVGVAVMLIQLVGPGQARAMSSLGHPARVPHTAPLELAALAVEARADFVVLDLRGSEAQPLLPRALAVDAAELTDLRRRPQLPRDRTLVVVDDQDGGRAREVAASLRASGLDATVLAGGALAWSTNVLAESAVDPRAGAYRLLISGESAFGGAPPPPMKAQGTPPQRKKKKSSSCS